MKRFGKRPSPAMVVSLIALFVALGGSAYAALGKRRSEIRVRPVGSLV